MSREEIIKVELAPWATGFVREWRLKQQAEREMQDLQDAVKLLSDYQLAAAIFHVDPKEKYSADVARFFFQELLRRDEKKALAVLRRWQEGRCDHNR